MNNTLLKTMECLQWMEDVNFQNGDMNITVLDDNTLSYTDIEDNLCILTFEGSDTIYFDNQILTFEEFLMILVGDEYTLEEMLSEINLDF